MPKKLPNHKVSYGEAVTLVYPTVFDKSDPVGFPKVVEKVVDGRVVRQVEFVIPDDNTDQFKCSDFALENLLAADVDLKELRFTNLSLAAVDKFIGGLNSLNLNVQPEN